MLLGRVLPCFIHPDDLAGDAGLGRALRAFLALFWGIRERFQVFLSAGSKREQAGLNALFQLAFTFFSAVFACATLD